VWTPRRIVLVVAGILLFSGGFTVYAQLFGWIDGLPPLPEKYTHVVGQQEDLPSITREGVTPIVSRLQAAFGKDCIEQTQAYNLKFEVREKGILFAAVESKILDDGRVRLQQVSVAVFGKNNAKEISTVHADRAFLTFEQPVKTIEDMGKRKITAAELHADPEYPTSDPRKGWVHITNNRKTADPNDDLLLKTPGPLYYVDEPKPGQPHIWTIAFVEMTDRQNRPPAKLAAGLRQVPTVTADGMRVYLGSEPPPTPGAPKRPDKKPAGSVAGVERVELDRNVVMNLWTESRNMLGGPAEKAPPPKKDAAGPKKKDAEPEKVLIEVRTNGPFSYDMVKEFAHFETPPQHDAAIQEYVKVTRKAKGNGEDTLTSDFLDIQFKRRKPADPNAKGAPAPKAPPADKPATPENDLEIETVHAWGKHIALSSDEDALFAFGNDLVYDAKAHQTVLKGAPMNAVKEGNLIRAPELVLAGLDDKEKQHMRARGPGVVGMGEMDPKTQEHSRQAHWNGWLVVVKVKEGGKLMDLVTLTGGASFLDTVNDQRLRAKQIKLWLLSREDDSKKPSPKATPPKAVAKKVGADGKPADDRKQPLPHRMEADTDVTAYSPELIVHKSDYLNVWFKDLPPAAAPPALAKADPKVPPPPAAGQITPKNPPPPAPGQPVAKNAPPPPAAKKDPPMELRHAKRIETWVNRIEGRNELDKVHTEGNVIIHQNPASDGERGTDVAGHTVDMQRFAEGNYLVVTGNDQVTGEVHFDKVSIVGDDIKIDQRDNTANVKGEGSMRLLSQTSLQEGKPLEKPTWVDIHWRDEMKLEGPIRSVTYVGRVQATQDDGSVLCELMQVWLDRPLYLNQMDKMKEKESAPKGKKNQKGKENDSPKVEKVLCDQLSLDAPGRPRPKRLLPVAVEDVQKQNGNLIRYQNVLGTQVEMDNTRNLMTAIGPGQVRIFQPGSKDPLAEQDEKGPKKKKNAADEEMKLTWIIFDERMMAFNNLPKRAVFYSAVELVQMPSDRHDVNINIAKLPERAFYLKCNKMLEVTTQSRKALDKNGKEVEIKWQEMRAEGNVLVRSDDFDGWAGKMTYSEEKSLLILTGTGKNQAVLRRAEVVGGERKTLKGDVITYNTKTKDVSITGSTGGQSN
jgi:hypothetical protein